MATNIFNPPIPQTNPHHDTNVSVNLTSSQIQFLTQHLQVEATYLKARINEAIANKQYPSKLFVRLEKISGILTNLGA